MNYALLTNERAKAFFQVRARQFNRTRATRETARLFAVTLADVKRAAFYW